jgi:hypothetical protein
MQRRLWIALACLSLLGCAEQAPVPKFPVDADEQTRRELYEQYKLVADIGVFSWTWKRRDGEYSWDALSDVARQYPDSADVYQQTNTRSVSLSIPAGAGAGIVSGTLVYNLTAPADRQEQSSTQVVLYSVGGGLIVASIIASLAWHNPVHDFADVYNRALRRQLGIPDSSPAAATGSPWLPHSFGAEGYGWSF